MDYLDDPRQYQCNKCETLTTIKDGQRMCRCFGYVDIMTDWVEVFFDRMCRCFGYVDIMTDWVEVFFDRIEE